MIPKQSNLTMSRDDGFIINRMKKVGVWKKMQEMSNPKKTASIILGDELFIWHGNEGDSGYTFFKCANPFELLIIAAKVSSSQRAPSNPTKH
ncbi:hypothetical protein [Methylobacter sp. S3L5C]|uniref:hypothetical protein n=1 Tax=Methylobacter sp. S3L5C TaxID=2839024 RepID=UPI001FAB3964|nr:hypothetical protein [Methylobacter sp. S3L5C]UOA08567.1 hypothetical protein KKZ03_20640 [Methylobacter sp. S3L5C]